MYLENENGEALLEYIVKHIKIKGRLSEFTPLSLVNLANLVAKRFPMLQNKDKSDKALVECIAEHIIAEYIVGKKIKLSQFPPRELCILANAVAIVCVRSRSRSRSRSGSRSGKALVEYIVKHVERQENVNTFNSIELSMLANAGVKVCPKRAQALQVRIAKNVTKFKLNLKRCTLNENELNLHSLANLLDALCKTHAFNQDVEIANAIDYLISQCYSLTNIEQWDNKAALQIYQAFLYREMPIPSALTKKINGEKQNTKISLLQQDVFDVLSSWQPNLKFVLEYDVIGSPVDIALLAGPLKVAIEVDGPYHDEEGGKCRDEYKKCLLHKQGWIVIRAPGSRWDTASCIANLQEKLSFVLESQYSGEKKKPSFSMSNPIMPFYADFRKKSSSHHRLTQRINPTLMRESPVLASAHFIRN